MKRRKHENAFTFSKETFLTVYAQCCVILTINHRKWGCSTWKDHRSRKHNNCWYTSCITRRKQIKHLTTGIAWLQPKECEKSMLKTITSLKLRAPQRSSRRKSLRMLANLLAPSRTNIAHNCASSCFAESQNPQRFALINAKIIFIALSLVFPSGRETIRAPANQRLFINKLPIISVNKYIKNNYKKRN